MVLLNYYLNKIINYYYYFIGIVYSIVHNSRIIVSALKLSNIKKITLLHNISNNMKTGPNIIKKFLSSI